MSNLVLFVDGLKVPFIKHYKLVEQVENALFSRDIGAHTKHALHLGTCLTSKVVILAQEDLLIINIF